MSDLTSNYANRSFVLTIIFVENHTVDLLERVKDRPVKKRRLDA